jgi:prepilin-type N-terminal cleavage/methylation domain-containing protein
MRFQDTHKMKYAYSRRSTTGGRVRAQRRYVSGEAPAKCKLQIALPSPYPSPKGRGDSGQWAVGSAKPQAVSCSPGFTLIEMLIVVSIIMILMVVALRTLQPLEDRRVREAAREVNVYISSVQNRAMELGRPCGVILHRAAGTNFPNASMLLEQCEVPPPYAGDLMDAVVQVQDWSYKANGSPYWTDPATGRMKYVLKIRLQYPLNMANNLIRPGDLIQLNGQGPYFAIALDPNSPTTPDFPLDSNNIYFDFTAGADTNGDGWIDNYFLTLALDSQQTPLQALPWPAQTTGQWSSPVSFLILRQPVKSSARPLQLPSGAVIDLHFSDADDPSTSFDGSTNDVAIVFSSTGGLEGYYYNGLAYPAVGPIFLLIGKTERINPVTSADTNDQDLSNLWVTINPQTGLVTTTEMAVGSDLNAKRQYARQQQQSMGGR